MAESIFGTIRDAFQVEEAAAKTLSVWIPTYLAELERQRSITPGAIARPRMVTQRADLDWSAEPLPAIVVTCPRLAGDPRRDGSGVSAGLWGLVVGVVASARDTVETRRLVQRYCAAIRTCLVQHQSLGGKVDGLVWADESFQELPEYESRTYSAGIVSFIVNTNDAVNEYGGPNSPAPGEDPLAPWEPWPEATDVSVGVVRGAELPPDPDAGKPLPVPRSTQTEEDPEP